AKNAEEHQKNNKPTLFSSMNSGPDYVVEIANKDLLEERLIQAHNEGKIKEFTTEKESNWGPIQLSFLPIILIAAIWIFMMRRMSGGAGAGGGGEILLIVISLGNLLENRVPNYLMKKTIKKLHLKM